MQDTILRVFVLAVSLLYPIPREDRTGQVQEQDDHIMGMQEREDWLLRERAKLEQEVSPLVTQEEGPINQNPLQLEVQQVYQIDQNHYQKGLEETLIEQKHSQENKAEKDEEKKEGSHIDHKLSQVHQDVPQTEQNLSPEDKEQSTIDLSLSLTLSQGNDQEQPASDTEASHNDKKLYHLDKDMANVNQQWPQEVQTGSCHSDQQTSPERQEKSQVDQQQSKTDQEAEQKVPPNFSTSEGNQQEHLTDQPSNTHQEVKVPPNLRKSDDQQHLTEQYNTNKEETPILSESSKDDQQQEHVTNIIDSESDYTWYLWNAYSLISFVHFSIKFFRRHSQKKPHPGEIIQEDMEDISVVKNLSAEVPLPDCDTLNHFYDKCVKVSPNESWRVTEFVEGFANDLLEAMRSMSDVEVGMVIEDFVVEGRISSLVCDIIVPIAPLEPYSFQFQLWCNQVIDDMPPEMEGCGRVKMIDGGVNQNSCPCRTAAIGDDDMLCLLCCDNEKVKVVKVTDVLDSDLCSKHTPYLAKTQVTKWFQTTIRKAWGQISHKYEFELTFRNMDAPGALMVRFRSGKVITFDMAPVVKLKDTEAYFTISPSTPTRNNSLDTYWNLSLTTYEDHFLKYLANHLPENSCHLHCLGIVAFLHKKQTGLTGRSILTNHHFKTVLIHLLLSKEPSDWYPEHLASRLRDALSFLENSLQDRKLLHSCIGKPLVPSEIGLPAVFSDAESVNLFRPLGVQNGSYTKTVKHLQEMLRNSSMLIQEYLPKPKECNGLNQTSTGTES
ncbi:inositol 1,4,5-trisphosphate receptor-interacting protein [Salmo trutta]|uniref:Inositol 1,4,5-trisphosphate receptor-interacting protein n=1 Tax=Salmo trutta TaxID=8032 RepID=A0A674ELG0_SALTR|nr:inositol 1,4,5-trisphosphate receptor-interacting protein-like [Salmo trutta]